MQENSDSFERLARDSLSTREALEAGKGVAVSGFLFLTPSRGCGTIHELEMEWSFLRVLYFPGETPSEAVLHGMLGGGSFWQAGSDRRLCNLSCGAVPLELKHKGFGVRNPPLALLNCTQKCQGTPWHPDLLRG